MMTERFGNASGRNGCFGWLRVSADMRTMNGTTRFVYDGDQPLETNGDGVSTTTIANGEGRVITVIGHTKAAYRNLVRTWQSGYKPNGKPGRNLDPYRELRIADKEAARKQAQARERMTNGNRARYFKGDLAPRPGVRHIWKGLNGRIVNWSRYRGRDK